nr:PREDICTED: uncharacterized protein LOC104149647 [Struthio camelus australis]
MPVSCRNMEKEDLNQKQVSESGPGHHKAATRLKHIHSLLNSSQNRSNSLRKELLYFKIRNCSVFNAIPLCYIGKEMPPSLSESAGRNSSTAASSKDSFCLHFSSEKDRLDRVSLCINSTSVKGWMEKACCFAKGLSSWFCPGDNSVCLAYFWLSKLQYNQNSLCLESETSSSIENELQLAFPGELEFGGLSDLYSIPVASLSEYTMGLLNNQKPCFFLCYLNLVSSEKTTGYKKMLSNIKYVTSNFHIIQLVTSVLAFALAGLWYGVAKGLDATSDKC